MKFSLFFFLTVTVVFSFSFTAAAHADDILDRPEKINFPPLKYEPPVAD